MLGKRLSQHHLTLYLLRFWTLLGLKKQDQWYSVTATYFTDWYNYLGMSWFAMNSIKVILRQFWSLHQLRWRCQGCISLGKSKIGFLKQKTDFFFAEQINPRSLRSRDIKGTEGILAQWILWFLRCPVVWVILDYHRFRWYATLENKTLAETFPKFSQSYVLSTCRIKIHQSQPTSMTWEGQKVTLLALIGGFRSDMLITRKIDGNFGNVSASVLFSKVVYQRKRW